MKKITITYLIICICLSFCACSNSQETSGSTITPTARINGEKTKEKQQDNKDNSKEPETSIQPETSEQPETSDEPEDIDEPETLNQFEALEADNNNTIKLDSNISALLTKKTKSYIIETKHFTRKKQKGKLEVEYPQLAGKGKDFKKVNTLIYELVDKNVLKEDESNTTVESYFEYEIKQSSDDIISILFSGYNNDTSAAHPNNIVFTFNYDLKSNKLIELKQVTNIDVDFLKKSKGILAKQVEKELYEGILLTNGDLSVLIDSLKGETGVFYFEKDKIYVGFTLNAAGNYTAYVPFYYH